MNPDQDRELQWRLLGVELHRTDWRWLALVGWVGAILGWATAITLVCLWP